MTKVVDKNKLMIKVVDKNEYQANCSKCDFSETFRIADKELRTCKLDKNGKYAFQYGCANHDKSEEIINIPYGSVGLIFPPGKEEMDTVGEFLPEIEMNWRRSKIKILEEGIINKKAEIIKLKEEIKILDRLIKEDKKKMKELEENERTQKETIDMF